jgi:hypothetical protein
MTDNFFKIAPFKIYSSSVDTGYATEISSSFKPGLDITNMHTDRYADLNDAPIQSPFTYKFVGGSQHRHAPLNDGTDTPATRPELFNLSMSAGTLKVVGPDFYDVNRPRAYFFRDTFAKRPINIANHKTTTGSDGVGNYSNDYEILQTVGRTTNNKAFVDSEGSGFVQYLTTQYVSGAKDPNRTLPIFSASSGRYTFVNRFNAPGGTEVSSRGVLDTYAEEYAPNNAMPWRNRSVRSLLRSDLARHTPKPGLGTPTEYHNDNRNAKLYKKISSSPFPSFSGLPVGASRSDNGLSIDLSIGEKKIYWSHPRLFPTSIDGKIYRTSLSDDPSGQNIEEIYSNPGKDLTDIKVAPDVIVDTGGLVPSLDGLPRGRLFWFNDTDNEIWISFLDGSSPTGLVSANKNPGFDVYPEGTYGYSIYYVKFDSGDYKIFKFMDNITGEEEIWNLGALSFTNDLVLDQEGKIYWVDTSNDRIRRANQDGSGTIEDIYTASTSAFSAKLFVDKTAKKLYVSEQNSSAYRIFRINYDGTGLEVVYENFGGNSFVYMNPSDFPESPLRIYGTFGPDFEKDDFPNLKYLEGPEVRIYDNGFVSHETPQADLRYAWIAASALTTESQLPGHQHSSSAPFGPYDDIDYVLSSSDGRGDFIGISGSALNKSNISVITSIGSENFLSKSSGVIFDVYNGPYQHSSWKQVRNYQNPIVRQLARESILSLANTPKTIKNKINQQVLSKRSDGITNFKEPAVSEDARPSEHTLLVRPSLDSQTQLTSSFKYTIANDVSTFTNQKIRDRLGIKRNLDRTLYREVKDTYLDPELVNASANPVDSFVQMDYSRVLYPSPINAFLNTTRERTDYPEVAGTGSNGYDRIFGKQRTFYKENLIRSQNAPNSQGQITDPANANDVDKIFDPLTDEELFTIDSSSRAVTDFSGSSALIFGTKPGSSPSIRTFSPNDAYITSSLGGTDISMSLDLIRGPTPGFSSVAGLNTVYSGTNFLFQYKSVATGTLWQTAREVTPAEVIANDYTTINVNFDPGEPVFLRLAQENFQNAGTSLGYNYEHYAFRNFRLIAAKVDPNKPALNFNSMATDGIRSFPESGSYRNYNGELMQDSDETAFTSNPLPSLSYLELYNVRVNNTSSGYVERLTEQIAGKNSWYDTYGEYAADVRPHSKNKSIIPEFRMSEHIPYYVIEKGDLSFRSENKKFLSLDGASIASSADDEDDCTFNSNFINRYVRTTDSGRLVEIAEEHSDGQVGEISKVEFSCKALKKLLPYNGFYPKERTVQLGNLLSESLGGNVEGSYEGSTTSYPKQGWMGILKPLMSPGILYNTIKSGIAVDYPIYTGSVPGLVGGSTTTPSDFQLNTGPNYRLPFETLIDLKGNLPEGTGNPIRLVSSFVTDETDFDTEQLFNYKSSWSGEKTSLFELGMHNFLAESVNFFLEGEDQSAGGKLTSFRSTQQPAEGWQFDSDKTYYMDVILRDTVEMNKFIEYSGSGDVVETSKFYARDGQQNDGFGYAIKLLAGSSGDGMYAIVGAYRDHLSSVDNDEGSAYVFQNKLDTTGWKQKLKLTASTPTADAAFGSAVDMFSSSNGLYFLVGEPDSDTDGTLAGAAYLFHSTSAGVTSERITPDTPSADKKYGRATSIVSGSDGLYFAIGATLDDTAASNAGATYLYHSTSAGRVENILTASDAGSGDFLGRRTSIVSSSNGIYVLAGAAYHDTGLSTEGGAAYLFHSTSAGIGETKLTASDYSDGDHFGLGASLVSGTDGIYALIGAPDTSVLDAGGAAYLYRSTGTSFPLPSDSFTEQKITGTGITIGDDFGLDVSMLSSSTGIHMAIGALGYDFPFTDQGRAYTFLSSSSGLSEQILSSSQQIPGEQFGYAVSLVSSSNFSTAPFFLGIGALGSLGVASGSGGVYSYSGEFGSLSASISIQNVQQDYKQHGKLFGLPLEDAYDPAYASYTPPMFYGESIARIKFAPATDTTYRLDEILDRAEVEEIINVSTDRVATVNGFKKSMTTLQKQNRMPISSSVNLFGKYFEPGVTYDPVTGNATGIDQTSNLNPSWVISTRFECPILDMSSSKYNELYTAHAPDSNMATNYGFYPGELKRFNPRAMWASYGQPPKGTKRTTLELANSFPDYETNPEHASLSDACGFTPGDKDIGKVRGTKQVFESVVMVPYLDEPVEGVTTEIEGKNFIAIDSSDTSRYADQKSNFERFGYAVQAEQNNGEKIEHTSITRMLKGMQMFNLPPNMDFYKHADITPFAMYFFPFSKDLSRAELADIWQGVMPQSATRTEDDRINVSHDVNKFEFFGNLNDRTLISKMRFMVFKVKQVAKQNYYEITEDATDDSRYKFKFSADGQAEAVPHPSYNWPYDYFSLVEDATIEAKYTIKNNSEE